MGYGYAAVQLITAWQRMNVPVWSWDRDAPVVFNFGQPHFYERVEGKLNIGYTPWESTKLPDSWPTMMNQMDEIWTPCSANATWFEEGGITVPVRVLHHGLNRRHWPLKYRTKAPDEPFKFLHVGGDAERKGADMVYNVFRKVFGNDPSVELILKGRKFTFDPSGKNVRVVKEVLPLEELTNLYLESHAMVYPTKGEGFGFIPFQAAATGMPTAVTNWSGPTDYMTHCFPIRVEELVEADYEPHEGLWAKPDELSVAGWMESFVRSPKYFFNRAYRKAQLMEQNWSWDHIAKIAVKYMNESLIKLPS
jgi:glycosyltransferase involved in cell wall biosynthesis